jgi:hypothetical protein
LLFPAATRSGLHYRWCSRSSVALWSFLSRGVFFLAALCQFPSQIRQHVQLSRWCGIVFPLGGFTCPRAELPSRFPLGLSPASPRSHCSCPAAGPLFSVLLVQSTESFSVPVRFDSCSSQLCRILVELTAPSQSFDFAADPSSLPVSISGLTRCAAPLCSFAAWILSCFSRRRWRIFVELTGPCYLVSPRQGLTLFAAPFASRSSEGSCLLSFVFQLVKGSRAQAWSVPFCLLCGVCPAHECSTKCL